MSSAIAKALHVLLIDSDREVLDYFKEAFTEVFAMAGFHAEIVTVASGDQQEALNRSDPFKRYYFDIVICDVSLSQSGDKLGLSRLWQYRRQHPGVYAIAYSGQPVNYEDVATRPSFDLFVAKNILPAKHYKSMLVATFGEELKLNTAIDALEVEGCGASWEWEGIDEWQRFDLLRAIRKITFTGAASDGVMEVSRVCLTRTAGGLSGALVFHLQAYTVNNFPCIRAVLKVGLKTNEQAIQSIRREILSYKKYVRWHLPYTWRPELLGAAHEGSLSALCYAFVGSGDQPFDTLSNLCVAGDTKAAEAAIGSIFHPTLQRWYDVSNVTIKHNLSNFYMDRCFGDDYQPHQQVFRRALAELGWSDPGNIRIDSQQQIPYPWRRLFSYPPASYCATLIHGDLNTRNVFISTSGTARDVALIDFSETGIGHVFFDFVVFEVTLRLDYTTEAHINVFERIQQEKLLNACSQCLLPFASLVRTLREFAFLNFPREARSNYFYGLAAFSLAYITVPGLSLQQQRALACCTCAALESLQIEDMIQATRDGDGSANE